MLKKYFGFTFFLYLITAVILAFLVNGRGTQIKRLNHLYNYAFYPISLNDGMAPFDATELYRTLTYYKTMAELYPRLSQADEMVGYCYFFLKDYNHSQLWLEKAIKVHPERIWVTYNLGIVAYKKGDAKRAITYFQQIDNGDSDTQASAAVLSDLSTLTLEKRRALMMLIPSFVEEIREKSLTAGFENDGQLLMHPWWHLINPGQELYY